MCTHLDYLTVLKCHNAVGVSYCGKSVGNDEAGAPLGQTAKGE